MLLALGRDRHRFTCCARRLRRHERGDFTTCWRGTTRSPTPVSARARRLADPALDRAHDRVAVGGNHLLRHRRARGGARLPADGGPVPRARHDPPWRGDRGLAFFSGASAPLPLASLQPRGPSAAVFGIEGLQRLRRAARPRTDRVSPAAHRPARGARGCGGPLAEADSGGRGWLEDVSHGGRNALDAQRRRCRPRRPRPRPRGDARRVRVNLGGRLPRLERDPREDVVSPCVRGGLSDGRTVTPDASRM